jgi:hypothetical protein
MRRPIVSVSIFVNAVELIDVPMPPGMVDPSCCAICCPTTVSSVVFVCLFSAGSSGFVKPASRLSCKYALSGCAMVPMRDPLDDGAGDDEAPTEAALSRRDADGCTDPEVD